MSRWQRWCFWRSVKVFAERKMKAAWMHGGNCDSRCPICLQWESHGNQIDTLQSDDASVTRVCSGCGHKWVAIFTPAGFLPIRPCKSDEAKAEN